MILFFILPVVSVGLGGWLGWWLIDGRKWGLFLAIMAMGIATFIVMAMTAQNLQGYDGLGRILLAVITILPLEAGMMIGGGIVAVRHRMKRNDT